MSLPQVSIVIPSIRNETEIQKCVNFLLALDYPLKKIEIIIVSPKTISIIDSRVKTILTKDGNPARNRNIGVNESKGELIGFIDDDCYVPPDWLKKGVNHFEDEMVAVVGGPGIPPPDDPFPKRCGGYIMSSPLTTGKMMARYGSKSQGAVVETDESGLILCNNIIRKSTFLEVSGFDEDQVPCEENVLYHRIKQKGYRMLLVPDITLWHSIRPIFWPIASRNFFYAIGRGVMLLRFPETFKIIYIIPALFLLSLISIPILSMIFPILLDLLVAGLLMYFLASVYNAYAIYSRMERNLRFFIIVPISVLLIHLAYGLGLLYGVYLYIFNKWRDGGMLKKKGKY